jgi:hypothetical protein
MREDAQDWATNLLWIQDSDRLNTASRGAKTTTKFKQAALVLKLSSIKKCGDYYRDVGNPKGN